MGNTESVPSPPTQNTPTKTPPAGCPMHEGAGKGAAEPVAPLATASSSSAPPEGCPMHEKGGKRSAADEGPVYNARGEIINPANMMPAQPQNSAADGQDGALSTERVKSSIPKAGTVAETWVYPSPQMFYNALKRKNKADGVDASDMDVVVSIHNRMNELTWEALLKWEKGLHGGDLAEGCPKLRRFHGRPYDLSPKAKIKSWLGYGYPFDRHDWYIDRGDGEARRYVIDYYFDPKKNEAAETHLEAVDAITIDVRPAVDSIGAVVDRLRRFPERAIEGWKREKFEAQGLNPDDLPREMRLATELSRPKDQEREQARQVVRQEVGLVAQVNKKCSAAKARLHQAQTEDERATAHIALNHCVATIACPKEAQDFMDAVQRASPSEEKAFHAMTHCVQQRMQANRDALSKAENDMHQDRS